MSGRRGCPRVTLKGFTVGGLRLLKHVTIAEINEREAVVLSSTPVVKDQMMSLYVNESGRDVCLRVSVIDSRPVVRNGNVVHELRLAIHDTAHTVVLSQENLN